MSEERIEKILAKVGKELYEVAALNFVERTALLWVTHGNARATKFYDLDDIELQPSTPSPDAGLLIHRSDCAIYNEPAIAKGKCDCGVDETRHHLASIINTSTPSYDLKCVDEIIAHCEPLIKAKVLKEVSEFVRNLPTDGWDKWHFYNLELSGKILMMDVIKQGQMPNKEQK